MGEKRRGKPKKQLEESAKPSKVEYAVAKHLRFNLPSKEGKLMGMTVQYFVASKAVDALLDSKWAREKEPIFTTRASCVEFCQRLLVKGLFHRAARVERKKDKKEKKKKKDELDSKEEERKARKRAKSKAKEKEKEEKEKEREKEDKGEKEVAKEAEADKDEKTAKEKEDSEKKDEEKKKKREKKLKMEMHNEQSFKDGDEVYVWIYDPVRPRTFIIGLLLVLGAIAVCLFPLWPPEVRLGVYYLSLAAAGFVGVILSLCVVRLILFCLIWLLTMGKHHFWFLPNLTEDVGFFDSFKPLYTHSIAESQKKETDKSKHETDQERTVEKLQEEEPENADFGEDEGKEKAKDDIENEKDSANEGFEKGTPDTGSENGNGYEIVDPEEVENMIEGNMDDDDGGDNEEEEEEGEGLDAGPPKIH